MLKQILITTGIIIILIAFLAWVYLLLFGTPESAEEVFTDLGLSEQPDRTPPPTPPEQIENTLIIEAGLQQLTTKPVAGFVATINDTVRYAEQGTGHIYEIDLTSQTETRITGTTIPRTQQAVFSDNGQYVALSAANSSLISTFVGEIDPVNNNVAGLDLPPNSKNIALFDTGYVTYTLTNLDNSTGYLFDIASGTIETLFTVPLTDYRVLWGTTPTSTPFIATKPARTIKGYAYELSNNQLLATPMTGFGLSVERNGDNFLFANYDNGSFNAFQYNHASNTQLKVAIMVMPEKCDISTRTVCAAPFEFDAQILRNRFPDAWYQGTHQSVDFLWEIKPSGIAETADANVLIDLAAEAGRTIDVTDLAVQTDAVFFRNRADNTLWTYE